MIQPFRRHRGRVAALDRANIDTDQIIPKQFLKRIERSGFGQFLFFDWRFHDDGLPNQDFDLNRPHAAGATILVARRNFGCGSSREHAVWALADYGFRAVLAPSFADIFYSNCFKNGLLPVVLDEPLIDEIIRRCGAQQGHELMVDLELCRVHDDAGFDAPFEVEEYRRHGLLHGLDEIALTLEHEAKISEYEKRLSEAEGCRREEDGPS